MSASFARFLIILTLSSHFVWASTSEDDEWELFKQKHNKSYEADDEEQKRRNIYSENKKAIETHNQHYHYGLSGIFLEINEFGDLASEEFALLAGLMGFRSSTPLEHPAMDVWSKSSANAPSSMDWRDYGAVTPVKNQGRCGACWAFSATGSLEGQHAINSGQLISLSEQNLIDCNRNNVNDGCHGGNMDNAFQYVTVNNGIDTEASYPFTQHDGVCRFSNGSVGATANGYRNVPSGREDILRDVVATIGPVSVAIDASGLLFQFYKHGVYYNPLCASGRLNHGVLLVGYGSSDDGDEYWIVKNSWGPHWGHEGYIYMSRDKGNNCGIATAASYPIV